MNKKKQYHVVNTIQLPKESSALSTHLKLELLTLVNGEVDSVMAMVNKSGLMAPVMKEIGKITEHKVKENSFILMATFMKVTG